MSAAVDTDPKSFMSKVIFGQHEILTYRSLSRALGIDAGKSKQLLREFYSQHQSPTTDSIYATYLVTYDEAKSNGRNVFNEEQRSETKLPSGSLEVEEEVHDGSTSKRIQMIVRDTHLNDFLESHDRISSVHIYSVAPTPTSCLTVLGALQNDVSISDQMEMPTGTRSSKYGSISNGNAQNSSRLSTLPASLYIGRSSWLNAKIAGAASVGPQPGQLPAPRRSSLDRKKLASPAQQPTSKAESLLPRAPSLKKESSDFFGRAPTTTSTSGSATTGEAAISKPVSKVNRGVELGGDSKPTMSHSSALEPGSDAQKERQDLTNEREIALQRMMDDSDNSEAEAAPQESAETLATEGPNLSSPEIRPTPIETLPENNGHRGKRKVVKKVTTKDEEGYLVTREESTWEDIPGEETGRTSDRKPVGLEKGPKLGQGSIMSFFKKK